MEERLLVSFREGGRERVCSHPQLNFDGNQHSIPIVTSPDLSSLHSGLGKVECEATLYLLGEYLPPPFILGLYSVELWGVVVSALVAKPQHRRINLGGEEFHLFMWKPSSPCV